MDILKNSNIKFYLYLKTFFSRYLLKDLKFFYFYLFSLKIFNSCVNIYMPKTIKKFSVVRSPTMSKLSKEQFEFRFYKVNIIFNVKNKLDYLYIYKLLFNINFKFSYFKCILIKLCNV